MRSKSAKILIVAGLFVLARAANGTLTVTPDFTSGDTSDFQGSTSIANTANAATIEATINQAIAQVTSLISNSISIKIAFVNDPSAGLGESVAAAGDINYSTYLSDLKGVTNKSSIDNTAIASLPAGPSTGINSNATQVFASAATLLAIGETTLGNSFISQNNGFAGAIGLDMSVLNDSRTNYDTSKYDLVSTVTHELDEILGIGGEGSTLGDSASDIGTMDLYRYSANGVRSYATSKNVSSYLSIDSGKTKFVSFNQLSGGDYGDWGDGLTPADGDGNTPPQVQDAFGDTTAEPNMGRNEAIELDVDGWNMTSAGLSLEGIPEPSTYWSMLAGGLVLLAVRRRRVAV